MPEARGMRTKVLGRKQEEDQPRRPACFTMSWGEGDAPNIKGNDPKMKVRGRGLGPMRQTRGTEEGLTGHYPSHPDHSAEPSADDLRKVLEPDLIWLIVSVMQGKVTDIKAHRLDAGQTVFHEKALEIVQDD